MSSRTRVAAALIVVLVVVLVAAAASRGLGRRQLQLAFSAAGVSVAAYVAYWASRRVAPGRGPRARLGGPAD